MNIQTATLDELTYFIYSASLPDFTAESLKAMCKESGDKLTMFKIEIAEQSAYARKALEKMDRLLKQFEKEYNK